MSELKVVLVIDWRKKQRTKARVQNIVDNILQELQEAYDDDKWQIACDSVFMHNFDKFHNFVVLESA